MTQLTLEGDEICEWGSVTDASKGTKITRQAISKCLNGETKTSGGFIWKFKE